MSNQRRKPTWWMLYALLPLMLGLLWLISRLPLTPRENEIGDFIIVLFAFGMMLVWLRVNAGALMEDEIYSNAPDELRVRVYPPQSEDGDPEAKVIEFVIDPRDPIQTEFDWRDEPRRRYRASRN